MNLLAICLAVGFQGNTGWTEASLWSADESKEVILSLPQGSVVLSYSNSSRLGIYVGERSVNGERVRAVVSEDRKHAFLESYEENGWAGGVFLSCKASERDSDD